VLLLQVFLALREHGGFRLTYRGLNIIFVFNNLIVLSLKILLYLTNLHVCVLLQLFVLRQCLIKSLEVFSLLDQLLFVLPKPIKHQFHLLLPPSAILLGEFTTASGVRLDLSVFLFLVLFSRYLFTFSATFRPSVRGDSFNFEHRAVI
jgi:hypothetical protein